MGRFFCETAANFSIRLPGLFVSLGQVVDLSGELLQPVLEDFVGDLLLIEGDHFLDGADALLEVLAHRQQFVNDNRRPRERFQHPQLPALDALGDFHFAFAREQRHRPHLAQIHADGVVGFFQSAGSEVEFDVLADFSFFFELLIERGGGKFRSLQHIDSLRTNGGQQIVQVLGRMHVVRDKVVDLVIGQISLLFTCVDQLFDIVVLVVKSQDGLPSFRPTERTESVF